MLTLRSGAAPCPLEPPTGGSVRRSARRAWLSRLSPLSGLAGVGVITLAVLMLGACAGSSASPPGAASGSPEPVAAGTSSYARVGPAGLDATLSARDVTLVNVHVLYEGEIEGTDRFIAYDGISNETAQLPPKGDPIVVYCLTGRMSAIAAATLVDLGYRNVTDLAGGMEAWQAAGYPLVERPS